MLYPAELRARAAADYQTWPDRASRSEAGVPAAVLADIGGRALVAAVGRRAVVKGEGAGGEARTVIMQIADRIGQRGGAVIAVVMARFGEARGNGDGGKRCCGGEELHRGHHDSPVSPLKTKPFWPVQGKFQGPFQAILRADWAENCGKSATGDNF